MLCPTAVSYRKTVPDFQGFFLPFLHYSMKNHVFRMKVNFFAEKFSRVPFIIRIFSYLCSSRPFRKGNEKTFCSKCLYYRHLWKSLKKRWKKVSERFGGCYKTCYLCIRNRKNNGCSKRRVLWKTLYKQTKCSTSDTAFLSSIEKNNKPSII